jgi:uncharacterized protein YndB with AHSA1/START domain
MESRDGSEGFDFSGEYTKVVRDEFIEYSIDDGRQVSVTFSQHEGKTTVTVEFDPEDMNSRELQAQGWQAILDNFKKYAGGYGDPELLHFEINIEAPPQKVFGIMLAGDTYRQWTTVFNPDSNVEGSWAKASKIVFSGTDPEGKTAGMIGRIKENIPGRFLSIEYTGIVKDGREITVGEEVGRWAGSFENYSFRPAGTGTLLSVDVDSDLEFKSFFTETWPKALLVLKALCEKA